MSGTFIQLGNGWGTTGFGETAEGAYDLVDTYYKGRSTAFKRSAGSAVWGENGRNNPIFGKESTAAIFSSDNIWASLPVKAYPHEGCRLITDLPTYGLSDATFYDDNTYNSGSVTEGEFLGLGAMSTQDGKIPGSVEMPYQMFKMPAKALPYTYKYGMYQMAVENKDDTILYKDYIQRMSASYTDLADRTILRPITSRQPVKDGTETSLNGIARCIANGTEINTDTYSTNGDITPAMVSPFGGVNGDFYKYRSKGYDKSTSTAHTENNIDGQVIDLENRTLVLGDLRKLYRRCQINWEGKYTNKVFFMSGVAQDKIGALLQASHMYLDSVMVEKDFHGVKTLPGRDASLMVASWNNVPIVQDGNVNYNYSNYRVDDARFGDITLMDLDHFWVSLLQPMELKSSDNYALTGELQEITVMNMFAETRVDKFICHGRIKNIADDL